jgi:two-component system sensor histidine kinase KdpD
MSRAWRLAVPYAFALAGTGAVTTLIAGVRPWIELPSLAAAYVLLVLWLGARYGWPPAVVAAGAAFVAYDWFLVPPYGTLYISAPRELVNLLVLIAAALLGGRLVAVLAARGAGAAASAEESGILYELAIAALQEPDGTGALALLCERARTAGGLRSMTLLAVEGERVERIAGDDLSPADMNRVLAAAVGGAGSGARLRDGLLELARTFPPSSDPVYVALGGGVAVLHPPAARLEPARRHLLAALLGLAGLLLDRRRGSLAAERASTLEASDRLKAAVLSSMSHELKSPLSSLRAGLTALSMPEAGLDSEQREMLAGLDGQATRLDRLVGDLLTMSRLEAGVPPELSAHDLAEMVGAVLDGLEPALADFRLDVALPDALPPVLADELQVERVLTNLLENAAEWTAPGGRIGVGARGVEGGVETWVENQGPEIPEGETERVFEKFWTRRRRGSGLGLAIARRVVEAHGGAIRVENQPSGPRFTFRLPRADRPQPVGRPA